jgi:hypothetical protein
VIAPLSPKWRCDVDTLTNLDRDIGIVGNYWAVGEDLGSPRTYSQFSKGTGSIEGNPLWPPRHDQWRHPKEQDAFVLE